MTLSWTLECSACVPTRTRTADGLPGVCETCGAPYLVRYAEPPNPGAKALLRERPWTMWRYREWLPLTAGEGPVTLGEGGTPLLHAARLAGRYGFERLWIKEEGINPTGSFKARGLAAAVTRAVLAGARRFVVPTAGNAGVALAAYATRAGVPARVYAPGRLICARGRSRDGWQARPDGWIAHCPSFPSSLDQTVAQPQRTR